MFAIIFHIHARARNFILEEMKHRCLFVLPSIHEHTETISHLLKRKQLIEPLLSLLDVVKQNLDR